MKKLLLILLLISSIYSQTNKKVTLQLNWLHQFQFAGYYVAKEKGYYNDVNLDVEIKEFNSKMLITDIIEQGYADFAVGRSSIIIDKANGKDIVAMFATYQHSPLMLLTRDDTDIQTLQDLKNRKIMMTSDATDSAAITAMLISQKLPLDRIEIIPHSFDLNDLITKKVDAMASYISNEPLRLEDKNIGYKIFHPKDFGFDFYSDILFTSSKFIKNNPKVTKDFYDATEKGWKYAFDNIGKTALLIYEKYNTQNKTLVELVSEGEALKKLIYHEGSNSIGCLDKRKLQKLIDIYKVTGLIQKDIDLDAFVYSYNKHNAFSLNLTHNELWNYILLAVIVVILVVVSTLYFIITRKWLITKEQLQYEIKVKTKRLNEQTYTDYLTKAKNKKAYIKAISEQISLFERYQTPSAIILFDIDNFKYFNDTYGHSFGDKVLIDLVKIVKSTIRKNDQLFRVGGEEFVVLFPNTTLNQTKVVSEYIRKNVEEQLSSLKDETITISIGVCEINIDDDLNTIYNKADKLMYQSKKTGKNKISF